MITPCGLDLNMFPHYKRNTEAKLLPHLYQKQSSELEPFIHSKTQNSPMTSWSLLPKALLTTVWGNLI